ncbi:hypothetical protein [Oceanobacillus sp. CF4.6]|uniref:hypothetical protein n=1 Tax=Oceanobacillus sp. CF4.6 TaxID=3373080 RepID=UPI003EE63FAE
MSQLSLFEVEASEVIIPDDVVSPLESNKSTKSKEFKKQQERWSRYVKAVQDSFNCSWFEASKLLISHRDKRESIRIKLAE